MSDVKYTLIPVLTGVHEGLFQLRAAKSFATSKGTVLTGELGGFVPNPDCLTHDGTAWVYPGAVVLGDKSHVCNNSVIHGNVKVVDSDICGNVTIIGTEEHKTTVIDSSVCGNTIVNDGCRLYRADVFGNSIIIASELTGANGDLKNIVEIADSAITESHVIGSVIRASQIAGFRIDGSYMSGVNADGHSPTGDVTSMMTRSQLRNSRIFNYTATPIHIIDADLGSFAYIRRQNDLVVLKGAINLSAYTADNGNIAVKAPDYECLLEDWADSHKSPAEQALVTYLKLQLGK